MILPLFDSDARFAHDQLVKIIAGMHRTPSSITADRVTDAGMVIEQFVTATGKRPEPYCLQRLADYILLDDLTDINKHKRDVEYPFHTNLQTRRRDNRHTPLVDGITTGG